MGLLPIKQRQLSHRIQKAINERQIVKLALFTAVEYNKVSLLNLLNLYTEVECLLNGSSGNRTPGERLLLPTQYAIESMHQLESQEKSGVPTNLRRRLNHKKNQEYISRGVEEEPVEVILKPEKVAIGEARQKSINNKQKLQLHS